MGRILKTSQDGSHTIYNAQIDETYHSVYGAITESEHVFINACYLMLKKENVKVLEVGFGTGLNAWLTLNWAQKLNRITYYESYEFYPLEEAITSQLNFTKNKFPESAELFTKLHSARWGIHEQIVPCFTLNKIHEDFIKVKLPNKYDAVYFDAFSPEKQPEMWTYDVFKKIYDAMEHDGILTTYCVKGVVKRLLKEIGFTIELLPGPPGKRHIIRAVKG